MFSRFPAYILIISKGETVLLCHECGQELGQNSVCPNGCQSLENVVQQEELSQLNKQGLVIGIISLVLTGLGFFVYHVFTFAALIASIIGIIRTHQASKQGQYVMGILLLNNTALILSSILSYAILLYYISFLQ